MGFGRTTSVLFLLTLLASPALPQSELVSLEGVVRDETGSPFAGVKVSVRAPGGRETSVLSDASGAYRFHGLPAGSYELTAEIAGFATHVRHFVVVPATESLEITMELFTLETLLTIEVKSASKIDQRAREAPGVVGVVTREQIADYGWTSLNDVLYSQPGFGPAQDYDRRTVSSRGAFEGWNNNHLLHLVDGVPLNDNLYGTAYTWDVTPLFMAKTIEVLRGPGSALYGSNAVNGVVQVNTLSAADLDGRGEARVRFGNAGTRDYDLLAGFGAGNLVSGVAGYNAHETDGNEYSSRDGSGRPESDGTLASFQTNDRRGSHYFWTKLEGDRGLKGLVLQYHDQYWDFQSGHGWLWWIPDFREAMTEARRIASLSYKPESAGRLSQEYLLRYQRHSISWNTRYYPSGAFDGYYPGGMWEFLDTHADDIFGRAQLAWKLPSESNLLVGVEGDRFSYTGDREHYSNVNVDDPSFAPFPDDASTRLGPWLDYILDQPIVNGGVYGQFSNRGGWNPHLNVTLGARYDRASLDYHDIRLETRPAKSRSFDHFSPRIAIVVLPSKSLSIKLLAGSAFRAPSPTELAGAHTFSLASNIEQLKPEVVTTGELALDYRLNKFIDMRANAFLTKFENEIAYSAANANLSTNVYTLKTAGFEAEILAAHGGLSAFLNYSYAHRIDEDIIDETIAPSPDALTWDPAHKLNLGVSYSRGRWSGALDGHYQGPVERRASDVGVQTIPLNFVEVDMDLYRPRSLDGWFNLDGRLACRLPKKLTAAVQGTNLFDGTHPLVKVLAFPFDYQREGFRFQASLQLDF